MKNAVFISVACLAILFHATSCTDNPANTSQEVVRIDGIVHNSEINGDESITPFQLDDLLIKPGKMLLDGSIESLHEFETRSDSRGRFSFQIPIEKLEGKPLVVTAETPDGELSGFISNRVKANEIYILKPLSKESSAETLIYSKVFGSGIHNQVKKTDVEKLTIEELSDLIISDDDFADALVSILKRQAEIRSHYMFGIVSGHPQVLMELLYVLLAKSQFEFEANLYDATTIGQRITAYDQLYDSILESFSSIGSNSIDTYILTHIQWKVIDNFFMNREIADQAGSNYIFLGSKALRDAVLSAAEISRLSNQTVEDIALAGNIFEDIFDAHPITSINRESDFMNYKLEILSTLEDDEAVVSGVLTDLDNSINESEGLKHLFEEELMNNEDLENLSEIYSSFENGIRLMVESRKDELGTISVEAVVRFLKLLNLFS